MAAYVVAALLLAASCARAGQAPDYFVARFETTAFASPDVHSFDVAVNRSDSPHGADRLYELLGAGFFNDTGFFRVVPGFVVQWGISGDPAVSKKWANAEIPDDPVVLGNARGVLSYAAGAQPNTRTTQVFVNLVDNHRLDPMGFSGVGTVLGDGMAVFDAIYAGYGQQPQQPLIQSQGNAYLRDGFPELDYTVAAYVLPAGDDGGRLGHDHDGGGGGDAHDDHPHKSGRLAAAHGVFMALAFLVLVPAGALTAALGRSDPSWVRYHMALMAAAAVCVFLGFVLVVDYFRWTLWLDEVHHTLGFCVLVGFAAQALLGAVAHARRDPSRASRPLVPNGAHVLLGRTLVVAGLVNVYYGLTMDHVSASLGEASSGWLLALYWVAVAAVVGTAIFARRAAAKGSHVRLQNDSGGAAMEH